MPFYSSILEDDEEAKQKRDKQKKLILDSGVKHFVDKSKNSYFILNILKSEKSKLYTDLSLLLCTDSF